MRPLMAIGLVLVILGVLALGYQGVAYFTTRETVARVGPVEVQAGDGDRAVEELLAVPELAKAAHTDEFRRVLDHVPIAIAVSRLAQDEQKIVYANPAFAALSGIVLADVENQPWSVLERFRHEDDASLGLGDAIAAGDDFLGTFRRNGDAAEPGQVEVGGNVRERIQNEVARHYPGMRECQAGVRAALAPQREEIKVLSPKRSRR